MAALLTGSILILSFLSVPFGEAKAPAPQEKVEKAPGEEKSEKKEQPGPEAGKEAPPPGPEKEAPKGPDGGKAAPKAEDSKAAPKPEAKPSVAPVPPPPRPKPPIPGLKTPLAVEKFQEGLKKFEAGDYTGARTTFTACLKDASTPADKKVLQNYIEDTKLGSEIDGARKMVERKEERKAISRVEKALKANPTSSLRPEAEKFLRETEELIFLILDDFEPGEGLQKETEARDASGDKEDDTKSSRSSSGRWRNNQSFTSDPKFVKHGKGSMKWKVGGAYNYYGSSSYYYDNYCYRSAELKNPITKWRSIVFWVYIPDADEGVLRVSLSPTTEAGVYASLYNQKLTDLRGLRGWKEIRLDLNRDFGNTRNVRLEDIHYVRIEYLHVKSRTLYLDFVHFE